MRVFITYGDTGFEVAKANIIKAAMNIGVFDEVFAYGREDLSRELLLSNIINIKRGGGLWSWKPDVINHTMQNAKDGDIIVYCDSGCSLQKSKEWDWYWKQLNYCDIIAQRVYKRNDRYTRKELIDLFKESNGEGWLRCYQYQATIIVLKISTFTRELISEWHDLMIKHPVLAMDVTDNERNKQHSTLIENRHDQAIFSALIYKYLNNPETKNRIYTCWERTEDLHPFRNQAIRATRLRQGEIETAKLKVERINKRLIKEYILRPFVFGPRQLYYSHIK